MSYNNFKYLILLGLLLLNGYIKAQQNHTLFLWHDLTQSNLLNPAVANNCIWYIGIPVLSSVHLNYANSSFTYNQLFEKSTSGAYKPKVDELLKRIHYRNFVGTEFHTQLFALGYKHKEYSLMITVTEKNNIPVTYPDQLIQILFEGNGSFVGDKASLKGTGVYFNHYREYGMGVSRDLGKGFFIGARAKLLFGKLNISTRTTNLNLETDETTFDLNFDGDVLIHTSLPINVDASDNRLNNIEFSDEMSPVQIALNRQNPGFAVDLGVIYPYGDNITLSASIIDLGFIRWRSNLNTFDAAGSFTYSGVLGDTLGTNSYFENLSTSFLDQMGFVVYPKKYTTLLPPRITAGMNYKLNDKMSGGVSGDVIIYKSKFMPSLTISGQYKILNSIGIIGSYTIQNYRLNNIGLGFFIGKRPLQFYFISDNLLVVLKPLDSRMINARLGINIILGCSKRQKKESVKKGEMNSCFGMDNMHEKQYLKKLKPWSKRKKK